MLSKWLSALRRQLADPKRWRRWALDALVVFALVGAISLWRTSGMADGMAPPLSGLRTDGSIVSLSGGIATLPGSGESPPKLGAGRTAPAPERARLVVFWASWCKVCKVEAGNIEALAEDWPVISVAMQSGERDEVAEYLEERGLTVPALVDDDGVIAQAWGVHAVPAHFVVDAAGNIRFRVAGYATKWGLAARLWWASAFQ